MSDIVFLLLALAVLVLGLVVTWRVWHGDPD